MAFGLAGAGRGTAGTDPTQGVLRGVLPGVDLKVRPLRNGVATDIVLASPAAPAEYVLPLNLKGLTASLEADGSIAYRDAKGAVRATTPKGHMSDSAVADGSGQPAPSEGVGYALVDLGGGRRGLKVTLDRAWLGDAARAYPVTVDPDVVVGGLDDTYNQSPYPTDHSGDGEVKVGTFNGGTNKSRAFFHFNLAPYAGKVISFAGMYAWETLSYSCNIRPMSLYRVTSNWGTISGFPGPSLGERIGGASFAVGYGSGCPQNWAGFDVTGAVQNWANGGWANQGLAFVADNETDTYGWKNFCSANGVAGCDATHVPNIQVTWSNPATVPTCAPTGQSASVNANGSVAVRWVPAPNNAACNGGSAITGYYVNWLDATGAGGTSYCGGSTCGASTISNLVRNRAYYAVIYTNNAVGFDPNPAYTNWVTVTAVPGAPTGAFANAGLTSAYVWWTPPTDPGSSGITQYAVWAYDTATNAFVDFASCAAPCTALTVSVAGMAPGKRYSFYVYAYNTAGWSAAAVPTTLATLTLTPVPNPVLNATAWAGDGATYLRWAAPPDNGAAPIDLYTVAAYGAAGNLVGSVLCNVAGTINACPGSDWVWSSVNNPGGALANGTAYKWAVFAHNPAGSGTVTGFTNTVTPATTSLFPPRSAQVTAGSGDAVVTWTAPAPPTGPGGGAPFTQYAVQRWNMSGPSPVYIDAQAVPAGQTALHWTGLANGTRYSFPVYTQSANGFSYLPTYSNTVTPAASIGDLLGDLLSPTLVAGVRGDQKLTLTWRRPIVAIDGLTTYTIVATPAGNQPQPPVGPTTITTPALIGPTYAFDVGGLRNGTAYTVTVRANNLVLVGPDSRPSSPITPAGRPFQPVNVAGTRGDRSATLTWQPPPDHADGIPGNNGDPITRYDVQVLDPAGTVLSTRQNLASGQSVDQLTNGSPYRFQVVATNAVGTSDPSQPSNQVIPAGRPFPPTNVQAAAGTGYITVTWTAAQDNSDPILHYTVTARPDSGPTMSAEPTSTAVSLSGLTEGMGYTFTITATNGVGTGDASAPSNRVVLVGPPDPPTGLRVLSGDNQVSARWLPGATHGSPITGYDVTVTPVGLGNPISQKVDAGTVTARFVGLDNGTAYSVAVVANSAAGPSNAAVATATPAVTPPPPGFDVPTGLPPLVAEQSALLVVRAAAGTHVGFAVTAGPNTGTSGACWDGTGTCVTDADGVVYWTYTSGPNPGDDTIEVYIDSNANGVRDTGEPAATTTQTWYRYVAMGDSYSAGEGLRPFYAGTDSSDNQCHRSNRAHPVLRGGRPGATQDPHGGAGFTFLSCSGAVIGNVRHDPTPADNTDERSPQYNEPSQLDASPGVTTETGLVTLNIGGNNMRFSDVLKQCAQHSCLDEPFGGKATLEIWLATTADGLEAPLKDLYLEARQHAGPNTSILVTGYPHLFPTTSAEQNCGKLAPFGAGEQDRLNYWTDYFNDRIRAAAAAAGVWYVDVRSTFTGHEVCGNGGEWINGPTLADQGYQNCHPVFNLPPVSCDAVVGSGSFHPNERGQLAYDQAISSFISDRLQDGIPRTPAGLPVNPLPT